MTTDSTPSVHGDVVGLSAAEVTARRSAGSVNRVPRPPSRTFLGILRANVVTPFNAVLGALFAVVVVVAPAQDALFGIVIAANILIGTVQEVRAKRTLDRLTILGAPTVRVVRDAAVANVGADEVVLDEVIVLGPGDQLVVDAVVIDADGLELDESLVTGESEPCRRIVGDEVLSGSFVVAGSGRVRAHRVGAAAFAADLTEQARRFAVTRSPLQGDVTTILRVVALAGIPAAVLLVTGQIRSGLPAREAATRAVAGVVTMVPEGLLLLTSVALAVGIVRLGARRCLVKELPAVELLARVTVVCVDKTGTLTAGAIELVRVEPLEGAANEAVVRTTLGALAAGDPNPNATMRAIGAACPPPTGWSERTRVPFDSARKWSGATLVAPDGSVRSLLVGAPEFVTDDAATLARVGEIAADGHRVVLVASSAEPLPAGEPTTVVLPADVRPFALVVLEEQVRPDAAETIAYFGRQGVTLKVISGDNPATVAAIADRLGVPGARRSVDARTLPDDPDALATVVAEATTFGRVTPHQKRAMVAALQRAGHVVAMTGDGVNDVLALKDADLGIAMGQGSAATRAVASVVLLDDAFASMPAVVAEGRRVIANIERVAVLFLTKTVAALWLAVTSGIAGLPYPFLPRHLSMISATAIGMPAFVLALAPADGPARGSFVRRAAERAAVTGTASAVAAGGAFAVAYGPLGRPLVVAQTAATAALATVMFAVLTLVARPLTWRRVLLVAAMVALAVATFVVPPVRRFLDLVALEGTVTAVTVGAVAAGVATLVVGEMIRMRRTGRNGVRDPSRSEEVRRAG